MKLNFHGACRTVTGSCFLLETDGGKVLVDCGMVQGSKTERELNYRDFPFRPHEIDAVILTHAHIDHSGLIPKLCKLGFDGPIYTITATADLCSIMLPDSGHIQEMEVQQLNHRNRSKGRQAVEPIYTFDDATACLTQFRPVSYHQWITVLPDMRARFWNAGHLLGSASVEIECGDGKQAGTITRLLFSGDIGTHAKLLEQGAEGPSDIDHLICESTYGGTDRSDIDEDKHRAILLREVTEARHRKGPLLIPSFAVERTQELLVDLMSLLESGQIDPCPIFIDSPLATRASEIFARHAGSIRNGAALVRAMQQKNVRFTETREQSMAISRIGGFHIIISASGMCEAGRIRHHLKDWLWRPEATVLLVGYQANGSLGRTLLEGVRHVRMMGSEIEVRATIRSMDVYSGHADAPELLEWVKARLPIKGTIFLVHGESEAQAALQAALQSQLHHQAVRLPALDETYRLKGRDATPEHSTYEPRLPAEIPGSKDWNNDFTQLIFDLKQAMHHEQDEKGRARLIRKIRQALDTRNNHTQR
jgi:metallo-beta-lactamase family protein